MAAELCTLARNLSSGRDFPPHIRIAFEGFVASVEINPVRRLVTLVEIRREREA